MMAKLLIIWKSLHQFTGIFICWSKYSSYFILPRVNTCHVCFVRLSQFDIFFCNNKLDGSTNCSTFLLLIRNSLNSQDDLRQQQLECITRLKSFFYIVQPFFLFAVYISSDSLMRVKFVACEFFMIHDSGFLILYFPQNYINKKKAYKFSHGQILFLLSGGLQ